jgi:hypothetical protein
MENQTLEMALRDFEVTANNFALRINKSASIRKEYIRQIKEMSISIRGAVDSGEISAKRGAEVANELRNQIMELQRRGDFDLGRSLAKNMKRKGITLDEAINKSMNKLELNNKPFGKLSADQQRQVYLEVIESAGHSRPKVTKSIPKMRVCARGLWLATFAIAAYNIGTAENPWWQSGRESANIAGGTAGSFAAGAALGAAGGVWAGPVGIAIGVVVGGVLGALLADHAYVECAGVSDPVAKPLIDQYTNFWKGIDEMGLAQALSTKTGNAQLIKRTFISLNDTYHTDVDDIAFHFINISKRKPTLKQTLRTELDLRQLLIQILDQGWTSRRDQMAINYLKSI